MGTVGWIGRVSYVVLPRSIRDSVDGRSAEQPTDGSAGRHRPASGRGEIEDIDRCAVRLLSQRLVEEREMGDRVVDSCR